MSIVRDIERGLAGLLLIVAIGLGAFAWFNAKRVEQAQQQYQHAAADARAGTVYTVERKSIDRQREVKNAEVETALRGHSEWADAPVPDDVADILRHSSGSTRAVP
ncbi:TPA: hypothetical protein QDZ36_002530 [Stenotrophomonas maltophilia]|nr:hypothetical protein [Stenotrophomonas maltophilia]